MVAAQEFFLEQAGLWANPELKEKYLYRLSPDVHTMTKQEKIQLNEISHLIYAQGGFIDGAISLFEYVSNPKTQSTKTGGVLWRCLSSGIAKSELPYQSRTHKPPFVCRLDLMSVKNPGNLQPLFQIAEIEGDKTHGFGYLTMIDYFRSLFYNKADTSGILNALKQKLEFDSIAPSTPITLIVGQKERFYVTELQMFSKFARASGINLKVMTEDQVEVTDTGIKFDQPGTISTTLISVPPLNPHGDTGSGINAEKLFKLYSDGTINCLIPPNRFLGSKALLGLISNGDGNPEIEQILAKFFDPEILDKLRIYIPKTIMITKTNSQAVSSLLSSQPDCWVIKKVMSSGTKGVALPEDTTKKEAFIYEALKTPYNYIIQKKVEQKMTNFSYSNPYHEAGISNANMYTRVELYACQDGIATLGITAREVPSVHVAKDAIQIPVVFEE